MKVKTLVYRYYKARESIIKDITEFMKGKHINFHITEVTPVPFNSWFIPLSLTYYELEDVNACYLTYRNVKEKEGVMDEYEDCLDEFSMDELQYIIQCIEWEYTMDYIKE